MALHGSRARSALCAWLSTGVVLVGLTASGVAAHADSTEPAVHFMYNNDFTGFSAVAIGYDMHLNRAVFAGDEFIEQVDTVALRETKAIDSQQLAGTAGGYALDQAHDVVYISGKVPTEVQGCNVGVPVSTVCGAAAPAKLVPPKIESVNLVTGAERVFTLPTEAAGQQVVAMTTAQPKTGPSMLYALLFADAANTAVNSQHDAGSSLTLFALDTSAATAATTTDPNPSPAAVLWSYPIGPCAGTPGNNPVGSHGSQPEFLGADPNGGFLYFGCRGLLEQTSSAHATPSGALVVGFPVDNPFGAAPSTSGFDTEFYPNGTASTFALTSGDAAAGLLYIASTGDRDYMRVFNAKERAWTGTVIFGGGHGLNLWGIGTDPVTARAYIYYAATSMLTTDADQLPVPAGKDLPLGDAAAVTAGAGAPLIDPVTHRVFLGGTPESHSSDDPRHRSVLSVVTDTRPFDPPTIPADPDAATHQIDVGPDTSVSYSGFARGYGARLIGSGLEGIGARGGNSAAQNALIAASTCNNGLAQDSAPACTASPGLPEGTRSVTVGQVDGTEVSKSAAKAKASTLAIDQNTRNGEGTVLSTNLDALVSTKFGAPPNPIPSDAPAPPDGSQQYAPASCGDFGGKHADVTGPGSRVTCDHDQEQAQAAAVSPGDTQTPGVSVASATSATRVFRTDNNHVVAAAESIAQGISLTIPGGATVTIGEVRTLATSTAAGRTGTAASDFQRWISNVAVYDASGVEQFRCGIGTAPSCDPRQLTDVVNRFSPSPVQFTTPAPDDTPRVKQSPGGAQAEIEKSPYKYWNDYNTFGDVSKEIAGLQVAFVADQDQPSRLTVQLAGVQVESHDSIDAPPPPPPVLAAPSLQLTLTDGSTPPVPLSGGAFTLQGAEGTEPLTCLTAADGIGTCAFTDLTPGTYTISETTPPPGYAAVDDYDVTLEPGTAYKTSFVNLPAIGSVDLTLSAPGDGAAPIPGADFALLKGTDVLATPLATCTTDDKGTCHFDKVPLGDYTMVQTTAPEGFLVSDSLAFSLTKPAQIAALQFVDGIPGKAAVPPIVIPGKPAIPPKVIPGKPAIPPKVIPGKPAVPPRTMVLPALGDTGLPALEPAAFDTSAGPAPVVASQPSGAIDGLSLGSGGVRAVGARLARLVIHSPQQAVLLLFVWLVLGLPVYLWVRRQQFVIATEGI